MLSDVEFFRIQAKHFLSDWKLANEDFCHEGNDFAKMPEYKYFDDEVFLYFDCLGKKEKCSLGRSQHYVAQLAAAKTWKELINSSSAVQKAHKYLYDKCYLDTSLLEEWHSYSHDCNIPKMYGAVDTSDSKDPFNNMDWNFCFKVSVFLNIHFDMDIHLEELVIPYT